MIDTLFRSGASKLSMNTRAGIESPYLLAEGPVSSFRSSKQFSALAVIVAYLLIVGALWSYGPLQQVLIWLDASWITCCTLLQRRSASELGLRAQGFRQSSWFPLAALVVVAAVLWIARSAGVLHIPQRHFHVWRAYSYFLWAFEQEFILQSFIFLNLEQVLGTRSAIISSTLLFASAHIPNPLLTVCTFFGGLLFTSVFARYRNLWTVGIVHALLGLTIAFTAPDNINHHMRVGLGYLRYHAVPPRAVIMLPAQK
jgi:membrane protease YdiL (CAAX protease family)